MASTSDNTRKRSSGDGKFSLRISSIPSAINQEALERALEGLTVSTQDPRPERAKRPHQSNIRKIVLAPSPSSLSSSRYQVAVVNFNLVPAELESLVIDSEAPDVYLTVRTEDGECQIIADAHFHGLTPLNNLPTPLLDIVAVTGLAGHAFGSWRSCLGSDMWLRDFIPDDLLHEGHKTRVLTYGYDTRLEGTTSTATMCDISKQFLLTLRGARGQQEESHRPIIFIGHSLGGLVIKQALGEAYSNMDNIKNRDILKSCYAILFFGVPNKGLDITQLIPMVEGQLKEQLVRDLGCKSQYLQLLDQQCSSIFQKMQTKVICFYETRQTPTIKKNTDTGCWERTGPGVLMVSQESAVHSAASETLDRIPLDANHSTLVKFSSRSDQKYETVLQRLSELAPAAQEVVEGRFSTLDDQGDPLSIAASTIETLQVTPATAACFCGVGHMRAQDFGPYHIDFSLKGVPVVNKFVDRPSEMEQLEDILLPRAINKRRKIFILHGLGGIGKTQLSVEFARKHRSKYSSVFWLDGRTEESLKRSIAAIAKHIIKGQIPEASRLYTHGNSGELDAVINDVFDWLSLERNNMWLLIFDNIDRDHSLIEDVDAYDIKDYLPRGDHGYILVTTRLISLAQLGTRLELKVLKDEQAMDILEQHTGQLLNNSPDAKKLLARLCGLPLAIAQAGAFIHAGKFSISEYLEYYEKEWMDLKLEHSLHGYDGSIQTTWNISYDHIKQKDETAANLLKLWAHLDSKDFWYGLLSSTPQDLKPTLYYTPQWFQKIVSNKLVFRKAITVLLSYSMIETKQDLNAYSMHPVVHEWALQRFSSEGKRDFVWLAVAIVAGAIPANDQKEYWILQQRLLPHADRCCRFIQDTTRMKLNVETESGYRINAYPLHVLGSLYSDQGKLAEAEAMYRRALEGYEKALGPDHTSTLDTVNNLGSLYSDQGKLAEAEAMYRRALEGYEKALGPDHTSTLDTVNNLGSLYSDQGKLAEAEAMYRRALEGKERR